MPKQSAFVIVTSVILTIGYLVALGATAHKALDENGLYRWTYQWSYERYVAQHSSDPAGDATTLARGVEWAAGGAFDLALILTLAVLVVGAWLSERFASRWWPKSSQRV